MRRPLLRALAAFVFLVPAVRAADAGPRSTPLRIGNADLLYTVSKPSLPGRFLFAPYNIRVHESTSVPQGATASLAVLAADGRLVYSKSVEARMGQFAMLDFKPLAPAVYSYFVMATMKPPCQQAEHHLLDAGFRDVPVPHPFTLETGINMHDTFRKADGSAFYVFCRKDIREGQVEWEFAEQDASGRAGFSWKTEGRPSPPAVEGGLVNPTDHWHLNSLSIASDGNLLVSFADASTVMKVAYPSGDVLWQMSSSSWTFRNDPLKGFVYQHAVRELPNGDLLFLDNGGFDHAARAVEYKLDVKSRTATMVWEYRPPESERALWVEGSAFRLPNGNTLIDWGFPLFRKSHDQRMTIFSEVDPAGNVVRKLESLNGYSSYRTYFEEAGAGKAAGPR